MNQRNVDPTKQPFRLTYQGKEYTVKYHHDQTPGVFDGEFSEREVNGFTEAYIQLEDGSKITDVAFCAAEDQFDKRKGRIVANAKLLNKIQKLESDPKCCNKGCCNL
jgi:hypothetical protein